MTKTFRDHRTAMRFVPLLMAIVVAVSACTGDDADESGATADQGATSTTVGSEAPTTTEASGVQRQPVGASAFFSIEEVVLGPDGYVVLNNFTDVAVTLDGLFLCQSDACFALPDEAIEAGGTAYLAVGDTPDLDGTVITGATLGELSPPDGELALYVTDPNDPEQLIAYLQWGSTPHDRTDQAIAKGLWLEGSYAPSGNTAVRLFRNPDSGLWLWDAG